MELHKLREDNVEPKIIVNLADGRTEEIDPKGKKNKDILKAIVGLDKDGEIITLGPGFLGPDYHE